ncbi:MAG: hypothetical protein LBQ67_02745 [Treponema sp.]|jgi:hypothetical protein|nr:hypothetical protein [Treponema sp.]
MKKNVFFSGMLAMAPAFVFGLVLIGCSAGNSPTTVVKAWVQAFVKGDATALGKVSTPESAKETSPYIPMVQAQFASNPVQSYSEKISEDGESAVVTLTFKDNETGTITLGKRDGKWLVDE